MNPPVPTTLSAIYKIEGIAACKVVREGIEPSCTSYPFNSLSGRGDTERKEEERRVERHGVTRDPPSKRSRAPARMIFQGQKAEVSNPGAFTPARFQGEVQRRLRAFQEKPACGRRRTRIPGLAPPARFQRVPGPCQVHLPRAEGRGLEPQGVTPQLASNECRHARPVFLPRCAQGESNSHDLAAIRS